MSHSSPKVLFVCAENTGRSQMAEAFAKKYGLDASSAGTTPSSRVNPIVVQAMKESGFDLSSNSPKMLTTEMVAQAGLVVTMGCSVEEVCPRPMLAEMQKKLVDWSLDDPKGKPIEDVRKIRNEIERRVVELSKGSPFAETMSEFLEVAIDKFMFKVARACLYTEEGMWARPEGENVRVGLSDFLHQRSGDVAFVEVKPAGTHVKAGEEIATIETVKVNVSLGSPVAGRVAETNPVLQSAPETINGDPYGGGWLAIIEASNWPADQRRLLAPEAYLDLVKRLAGEEDGRA